MSDVILNIKNELQNWCGETKCSPDMCDTNECKLHERAEIIYITHVKPIEDALEKAVADKAVLVDALETMLKAYEMILPGVAKISIPDYALMNEAPCKARRALDRVKE